MVTAGSVNSLCPSSLERHEVPVLLYVSRLIFPNELCPSLFSSLLPCAGRTSCHIPGDDGTSYHTDGKQGHQLRAAGKKASAERKTAI